MGGIQVLLIAAAQAFGAVLFFYVLYLLGGMAQDIRKVLQKVENIEKTLNTK